MNFNTAAIVYKGNTPRKDKVAALESELTRRNVAVKSYPTTAEPKSAEKLAALAARNGAKVVFSMGGDGSVREVCEGLLDTGTAQAILADGTGNLWANYWHGELDPATLADMVFKGQPQFVDVIAWGCTDTSGKPRSGISIVGVGFGSLMDAIGNADPTWKKHFGKAVYGVNMAVASLAPAMIKATLTTASRTEVETLSAALAFNIPPVDAPSAVRGCNACDGLIDLVGLRAENALQIGSAIVAAKLGKSHESPHLFRWRDESLSIDLEQPVTLNVDGDSICETSKIRLSVRTGSALMVLA